MIFIVNSVKTFIKNLLSIVYFCRCKYSIAMERLIKLLYLISILAFLVMMLYVYAFLPDDVNLSSIFGTTILSKSYFFYTTIILFVVLNLLASFFTYILRGILSKPNALVSKEKRDSIIVWGSALKLIISIFFTLSITFIGMQQNDDHLDISDFGFLVYIGPVLLIMWILSIFILLLKKK